MSPRIRDFLIAALGIALIVWGTDAVITLLSGLRDPQIDNNEIFKILGPIIQNDNSAVIAIVSGALGFSAGKNTSKGESA